MHGTVLGLLTVLAAGLPSAFAAYYSHKSVRQLKTGNDKTVGEMLTEVHSKESVQAVEFQTHREGL